jgi:hypothetical protein
MPLECFPVACGNPSTGKGEPMSRGKSKGSYVADPQRRAQLSALRMIREQVLHEHEKELAESGLLKRLLIRFRMDREVKKRAEAASLPTK